MAGTIAADVGFRVTQTGEFLRNPPKSSFPGMSPASFPASESNKSAGEACAMRRLLVSSNDRLDRRWREIHFML